MSATSDWCMCGGHQKDHTVMDNHSFTPVPEPLDMNMDKLVRIPTGLAPLDRLLGGGLVLGSRTLVVGARGTGKTTLLQQIARPIARAISVARDARLDLASANLLPSERARAKELAELCPRPPEGAILAWCGDFYSTWFERARAVRMFPSPMNYIAVLKGEDPEVRLLSEPPSPEDVSDPAVVFADYGDAKLARLSTRFAMGEHATVVETRLSKKKRGALALTSLDLHAADVALSITADGGTVRDLELCKNRFGTVHDAWVRVYLDADGFEETVAVDTEAVP